MLKGFTTILVKELKELMRDPKILIGMIVLPLIMFPVLGLVMGFAVQSAQEEAQRATLLVVDNDSNGTWSNALVSYLNSTMNVEVVRDLTPQNVVDQGMLGKYNSTMFLEIPSGFSTNLTMHANGARNITGMVNVYGVFTGGGGIFSGIGGTAVTAVVAGFNRAVAPDVVAVSQSSIIKGQI